MTVRPCPSGSSSDFRRSPANWPDRRPRWSTRPDVKRWGNRRTARPVSLRCRLRSAWAQHIGDTLSRVIGDRGWAADPAACRWPSGDHRRVRRTSSPAEVATRYAVHRSWVYRLGRQTTARKSQARLSGWDRVRARPARRRPAMATGPARDRAGADPDEPEPAPSSARSGPRWWSSSPASTIRGCRFEVGDALRLPVVLTAAGTVLVLLVLVTVFTRRTLPFAAGLAAVLAVGAVGVVSLPRDHQQCTRRPPVRDAAVPRPGSLPAWESDLALLAQWCAGPTPAIVAGDFNATLDHSAFRAGTTGCIDAAEQRGAGLIPTWADPDRPEMRPIGPQIDHVLATNGISAETSPCTTSPAATTAPSSPGSGYRTDPRPGGRGPTRTRLRLALTDQRAGGPSDLSAGSTPKPPARSRPCDRTPRRHRRPPNPLGSATPAYSVPAPR